MYPGGQGRIHFDKKPAPARISIQYLHGLYISCARPEQPLQSLMLFHQLVFLGNYGNRSFAIFLHSDAKFVDFRLLLF